MLKRARKGYRSFVVFGLVSVMAVTNIGANAGMAFAATGETAEFENVIPGSDNQENQEAAVRETEKNLSMESEEGVVGKELEEQKQEEQKQEEQKQEEQKSEESVEGSEEKNLEESDGHAGEPEQGEQEVNAENQPKVEAESQPQAEGAQSGMEVEPELQQPGMEVEPELQQPGMEVEPEVQQPEMEVWPELGAGMKSQLQSSLHSALAGYGSQGYATLGDRMQGDGMQGDAMQGDAILGDGPQDDAVPGDAPQGDALGDIAPGIAVVAVYEGLMDKPVIDRVRQVSVRVKVTLNEELMSVEQISLEGVAEGEDTVYDFEYVISGGYNYTKVFVRADSGFTLSYKSGVVSGQGRNLEDGGSYEVTIALSAEKMGYGVKHLRKGTEDEEVHVGTAQYGLIGEMTDAQPVQLADYIAVEIQNQELVDQGQIITIYYEPREGNYDAQYTVKYVDMETKEDLAPAETKIGLANSQVTVKAKVFEGYAADKDSESIVLKEGENEIVFQYTRIVGHTYRVVYQRSNGDVIAEKENMPVLSSGFVVNADSDVIREQANKGYRLEGASHKNFIPDTEKAGDAPENTVTFVFVPERYRIRYEGLEESGWANPNPEDYTVEEEVRLVNPEREGYVFVGWMMGDGTRVKKASENDHQEKEVVIEKGTVGHLVFRAVWEALDDKKEEGKQEEEKRQEEDNNQEEKEQEEEKRQEEVKKQEEEKQQEEENNQEEKKDDQPLVRGNDSEKPQEQKDQAEMGSGNGPGADRAAEDGGNRFGAGRAGAGGGNRFGSGSESWGSRNRFGNNVVKAEMNDEGQSGENVAQENLPEEHPAEESQPEESQSENVPVFIVMEHQNNESLPEVAKKAVSSEDGKEEKASKVIDDSNNSKRHEEAGGQNVKKNEDENSEDKVILRAENSGNHSGGQSASGAASQRNLRSGRNSLRQVRWFQSIAVWLRGVLLMFAASSVLAMGYWKYRQYRRLFRKW